MSRGYQIFIKYTGNIDDLNELVCSICYKEADTKEANSRGGKLYWFQIMGTEFFLTAAEDFENDRSLDFENYDYYVSTKMYDRYYHNLEYKTLCDSMAKFLGFEFAKSLKTKVLVCYDMQLEISRYDFSSIECI